MSAVPTYRVTFSQTRYVTFEKVTRNRIHRHSFFEPCIVISGTGEFEHAGKVIRLREADLFVADPGVYHEIRSLKTRNLRLYFLAFNLTRGPAASPNGEQAGIGQHALTDFVLGHGVHLPGQSHLIPLFEHAMKLARHDVNHQLSPFYCQTSQLLLSQIIANLTDSSRASAEKHREQLHKRNIVEIIEERLHEPLRIAQLATDCGMSERTLRRRWKRLSQRTLTDEISHRRIERASHLLLLQDLSVADVGDQVGIANPAQFSRLFKGIKKITPKSYREKYLGKLPGLSSGQTQFRTEFLDGEVKEYAS